jgi:phage terminase large subunit-like protein
MKIDKSKSAEKVDGMVALAMALGRASIEKENTPDIFI